MKKIFLVPIIFISVLFVIFIIAGTPFFLNLVKGKIENTMQTILGEDVPVRIGSLKGNLFYSVEIEEFNVDDIIEINRLKISYNIVKLLFKEIDVHSMVIDGLEIDMNRIETLTKKIQRRAEELKKKEEIQLAMRVKRLSIINSDLVGVFNDRAITLSLNMKSTLLPDVLLIDNLNIRTERSNIFVQGQVPIKEGSDFDLTYRLNLFVDELNFQGLQGRVMSSGDVRGDAVFPTILNHTEFSLMYRENELSGLIRINWRLPVLDSLNLEANVKTTYPAEKNGQKDESDAVIFAQAGKFFFEISSIYGSATVQGMLGGDIRSPVFDAGLLGKFQHAEFQPRTTGRITYKDNKLEFKDFEINSDELLIKLNALINTKGQSTLNSDVLITCNDLGVINNFVKTPQPIAGTLTMTTSIKGLLKNPEVFSTVAIKDLEIYGEEIRSVDFGIRMENHIAYLDSGVVKSPRGDINLSVEYNLTNNNFISHIVSDGVVLRSPEVFGEDTIPIGGNIAFDVQLHGSIFNPAGNGEISFNDFVYDTLNFDDYKLMFTVADSSIVLSFLDDKESIHLKAEAALYEPFSFNTVLMLHHFDFVDYIKADAGYITAQVSIHGTVSQPEEIVGTIQIDSLYIGMRQKGIRNVDDIIINVNKGFVDIRSCIVAIENQQIHLQGIVPLDLEQDSFNLSIKSSKIDIANIVAMVLDAPHIEGIFYADLVIGGTLKKPKINGQLNLEHVKYSLPDIEIDSVYSVLQFSDTYVNIDYIKGKINKGSFRISGFADVVEGRVDTLFVDLLFDNIDLRLKDYGSVVLSSVTNASARKDSFVISGEVIVNKAVYDVPFNLRTIIKLLTTANQPPPEQHEILKRIYCDIGISAPHGAEIANNVANVAVDFDLQLKGYLSKLNVYGTISTSEKGTVQYLGKKFEIVNAVIEFDNPYKIDPTLNLEARHFISSEESDYEIFMYLSGTVEQWHLDLRSNPPVPEQDIISLLLIGKRRPTTQVLKGGKRIDLEDMAKDYATGLVRGTIEETAERTLGLEKFTITGDLLDPKQLDIGVEKKFGKRLTLIYGTGIESWELRRIGINYDITDNLSIFTLHDQEHMNSSVDLDFHLKIK